jgi:hypothetical protein
MNLWQIIDWAFRIVGFAVIAAVVIDTVWTSSVCRCLILGHRWQASSWHVNHGTRRGDVQLCTRPCCRGHRRGMRHMHDDGTLHAGLHEQH